MTAGFTVVEYGGRGESGEYEWQLRNCLTERFEQEIVKDETRTDMLFSRFTIVVTGYIHGEPDWQKYHRRVGPESTNTNNAASEQFGMRLHLEPRKNLRVRVGVSDYSASVPGDAGFGTVLLYAEPWPSLTTGAMGPWDLDDGPWCSEFAITKTAANHVYHVRATFHTSRLECDSSNGAFGLSKPGTASGNTTGVLSNKWTVSDEIDDSYYLTRTYQGRLRIASSRLSAHSFRSIVVPPLAKGMKRHRMGFVSSADGKHLDWTVVDTEVSFAAPYPATDWNVTHTIATDNAAVSTGTVSVYLKGDRNVVKRDLFSLGMYIIGAKLYGAMRLQQQKKGVITRKISLTDEIGKENAVRLEAEVLLSANQKGFAVAMNQVFARIADIGKPLTNADIPNYDRELSRGGRPGEKIKVEGPIPAIGIFASRLQSPCNDEHETAPNTGFASGSTASKSNPGNSPTISAAVASSDYSWTEENSPAISTAQTQDVYTYYQIENIYQTSGMKAALPVAKDPDATSTSANNDDTCKVVSLGPGQSKRIVRVRAERAGDWPVLPKPVDYAITNYVVGQGDVSAGQAIVNDVKFAPQTTEITPTGERLYVAAVDIEYLLTRVVDASQPLRVGNNPWDTLGMQLTSGASMFANETGVTSV